MKRHDKKNSAQGSTLIELVLYVALLPLLLAALLPFVQVAVKEHSVMRANLRLVEQSRVVMEMMTYDLQTADATTVMISGAGDEITFYSRGYIITYSHRVLDGLYRDLNNGAGAQPVIDAPHIALRNLHFAYHEGIRRVLDVTMLLEEVDSGQKLELTTSVYLWN
jgi:type II secretory pathway component PulJ